MGRMCSLAILCGCLLATTHARATSASLEPHAAVVETFEVMELAVRVPSPSVANPFTQVSLSGTFTPEGGTPKTVWGFCDDESGQLFRIRFTPVEPGRVDYQLEYRDPLVQQTWTGSFDVTPGSRSGFVRVDPEYPTRFMLANGEHLWVASQTAWLLGGVSAHVYQAQFDRMVQRRQNVFRFGVECNYYDSAVGIDVWPWMGLRSSPDYTRFNVAYWQKLDEILVAARSRGLYAEAVLFTTLEMGMGWSDNARRYLDYVIARLAPHPNVILLETGNETSADHTMQTSMGTYLHEHDVYQHLVAPSFGTTTDAAWPTDPWVNVAINHSCTGDSQLKERYYTVATRISGYGKPGWSDETGREQRHGNDDGVHRRKQYWTWNMGGSHWNYHSYEGCEGIAELDYHGPGSQFLGFVGEFWMQTGFWRMRPLNSVIKNNPASQYEWAMASDGEVVVYLVNETSGASTGGGTIQVELPAGGEYQVRFYQPANGTWQDESQVSGLAGGQVHDIAFPAFTDDLVLHARRTNGTPAVSSSLTAGGSSSHGNASGSSAFSNSQLASSSGLQAFSSVSENDASRVVEPETREGDEDPGCACSFTAGLPGAEAWLAMTIAMLRLRRRGCT